MSIVDEAANTGRINMAGTYNGIPIYVDYNIEKHKVFAMKKTNGKPNRNNKAKEPRTKGKDNRQVVAIICHPSMFNQIKEIGYGDI